jgi:predicted nucleic-acid-binding protein
VKVTADTNILVRVVTEDDPVQSKRAQEVLAEAELVAMPLSALTEMCWVLERVYNLPKLEVARAVRTLTNASNVAVDIPAVESGLTLLDAGGDFADGVIAQEGLWLGAEIFVSFDRRAIRLLQAAGLSAREPA